MTFLGIDIGTTHSKAGLFAEDGTALAVATRPTPYHKSHGGLIEIDPEGLWQAVLQALEEVLEGGVGESVRVIGIASMAETGLLLDMESGKPRTALVPWFDDRARDLVDVSLGQVTPMERFKRTGLHPAFKYSLPKILWLREQEQNITKGALWLSASDYIGYRLTGNCSTDYTLAARTYGFRIDTRTWDGEVLESLGLDLSLFPKAYPSGHAIGSVLKDVCLGLGLGRDVPVAISGHDHSCAALAVGATTPGIVYDSMGTAESLMGTLKEGPLGEAEYSSGLTFGCHVLPGHMFWMGGQSNAGGSVEWLRGILSPSPLNYDELEGLLAHTEPGPSGIIYLPYLSGSASPWPDAHAQGTFIGLQKRHGQADLLKAVLEGTAFEMEAVRRSAEAVTGTLINQVTAVGGGTRNPYWMQIKADISCCEYVIPPISESTLLGAALVAGLGCGVLDKGQIDGIVAKQKQAGVRVIPDAERHGEYRYWYEEGYLRLQEPLREYYNYLSKERSDV
ncbi:MAG: carbohydrate kinase [Firmicutes bacterium]|nr:carbohydrate kinase [Bacillota bacterium]